MACSGLSATFVRLGIAQFVEAVAVLVALFLRATHATQPAAAPIITKEIRRYRTIRNSFYVVCIRQSKEIRRITHLGGAKTTILLPTRKNMWERKADAWWAKSVVPVHIRLGAVFHAVLAHRQFDEGGSLLRQNKHKHNPHKIKIIKPKPKRTAPPSRKRAFSIVNVLPH